MNGAWTRVEINGKPADVYDLPGGAQPRHGVLFLHGIGLETLVDNHAFTRLFDELGLACVCPHGQRSWWVDRVCPEFDPVLTAERHLIDDVLPFFRERWGLGPSKIGLLGISMGGQGALRLAFKYPKLFNVAVGIASALDFHDWYGQGFTLDEMYDSKEQARQDTATLHVNSGDAPAHLFFCVDPTDVDFVRGNDRLHEKLSALGVAHEFDFTTRAGGHSWTYFNHAAERAVRFLADRLGQQGRRLL